MTEVFQRECRQRSRFWNNILWIDESKTEWFGHQNGGNVWHKPNSFSEAWRCVIILGCFVAAGPELRPSVKIKKKEKIMGPRNCTQWHGNDLKTNVFLHLHFINFFYVFTYLLYCFLIWQACACMRSKSKYKIKSLSSPSHHHIELLYCIKVRCNLNHI